MFAKFRSGAYRNRTPLLQTTVFLFNLALHRDGTIGRFTEAQVQRQQSQLCALYESMASLEMSCVLGAYWRVNGIDPRFAGVPPDMCRDRYCDPAFRPRRQMGLDGRIQPLRREDYFAAWQREAKNRGWGVDQVHAFLYNAKNAEGLQAVVGRLDRGRRLGSVLLRKTKAKLKEWVVPRAVPQQPVPPVQSKDRDMMHSH